MADVQTQFIWPPIGQERAIDFLEKSLLSGKLAQTYVFAGPRDLGKSSLALAFARNLWRQDRGVEVSQDDFTSLNSDLYILDKEPEKKQISVEQARDFIKRLSLSSFSNSYKIGIIKEATTLSIEAQNALLKTLEEPKDKVIIILLIEDTSVLMPTILSRSQVLYFYPVSSAAVYDYLLASLDIKRSLAKELAAASLGRPLQARAWADDPTEYQQRADLVQRLFTFSGLSLSARLQFIAGAGNENNFDATLAEEWITIWEGLWRDALLLSLGQEDRLQYPALAVAGQKQLAVIPESERSSRCLANLKQLQQARAYIRGFVNPKHVLESLAIYF